MTHFSTEDWIDFVRQVADSGQMAVMQKHLNEGCLKCETTMETWRRVVNLAEQQQMFQPPAAAVKAAQAMFALRNVIPFPTSSLEWATLVSDSARQPLAAGMRGGYAVRQLLYKSGSICIDMRMQPKPGSDSVVLMGQLLDSANPDHGLGGVPVSLLGAEGMLSRNKTNDVGEFDFGVDAITHLQLVFGMGENRTIIVPIPEGEGS